MIEDLQAWISYLKYGDPSGWHIAASLAVLVIGASVTATVGEDIKDGFKRWWDSRTMRRKNPLGWNNEREQQELWINVREWQHKVFVEPLLCETIFDFEGVTDRDLLSGTEPACLRAMGQIEIPLEALYPGEDDPRPDNVGELYLTTKKDLVNINLRVDRETFAELIRTFSATFGNNGGISLALNLKHHSGAESGFWQKDWQRENIQIWRFRCYAGMFLHRPKSR